MAAAKPILPPEEVALLELGKVAPATHLDKVLPAPNEHPGDPDATLLWDQCQHGARGQKEPMETKRRSSPEGGREDPEEAAPVCPPAKSEDDEAHGLPVMAAHVFVPINPQCIERKQKPTPWPQEEDKGGCVPHEDRPDGLRQKQVFLPVSPLRCRDPVGFEGLVAKPSAERSSCPCIRDCSADGLKAVASVVGALFLCPCLIYGAYVFLPFDAPLLPTISARLVYTLRCAAFATFPIVLGEPQGQSAQPWAVLAPGGQGYKGWWVESELVSLAAPGKSNGEPTTSLTLFPTLLHLPAPPRSPWAQHGFTRYLLSPSLCPAGMIVSGISRLCSPALEPFGELQQEVEIHRTYVSQSIHLFILYFFNMAVLATYLQQEVLKLIPLLTGLFAISR